MSTTTANLGLIKPELSDAADITLTNENWDKIDQKLSGDVVTKEYVDEALRNAAPTYTYGTEDLTAGVSPLESGKLYFVYE